MKQAQPIRQTYQFHIQALTPVHIGCGKNYIQGFDYIKEGNRVHVFDQARLFAQVEALGESAITAFTAALEERNLSDFIKEKKIDLSAVLLYSFPWASPASLPTDIRRYIRDGLGRPFIPGSSLKGLFRSAILSRLVEEDGNEVVDECIKKLMASDRINPKYAANTIAETMLGKDAKYNLMRSLTVSDCALSAKSVQVDEAFITRIVTDGRRFERKRWSMLIERVRLGESATGQVSFDPYLQKQAQGKPEFKFRATLTLEWLLDALRRRTERFLAAELRFLADKSGEGVSELQRFYTRLQQEASRLDPSAAIVQFAWGSGWKAMTGELLQPEQFTHDLRNKLNLATKYLDYPFPKSRRLVGKGEGVQPIGWVKLTFREKGGDRRSVPKKTVDPRQALLNRIETVQNWDDLKKVAESDADFANNHTRGDVAEAFKAAALRVQAKYPKTWDDDRDQRMIGWLDPSGVAWPQRTQAHQDTPTQVLSVEEQERIDRILNLKNWGQFNDSRLQIDALSFPEAEALNQVFCRPEWGVNKKSKNEEKRKTWKALAERLRRKK